MTMDKQKIHTIELNLDDDFANACAYHVDDLKHTIVRNIQHAESYQETNRWVLVGLANSLSEALDKTDELRKLLCERNKKIPYGIEKLMQEIAESFKEKD